MDEQNDKIIEGDLVNIEITSDVGIRGYVRYTPAATGDSWRIETALGELYYVQNFLYMRKLPKEGQSNV